MFDTLSAAIISAMTIFINSFSGLLQIAVYLSIGLLFFYALGKSWQAVGALSHFDFRHPGSAQIENGGQLAPLTLIAADCFYQTKKHYMMEKRNDPHACPTLPPDSFIRDAALQYSERYFAEKFLDPIAMTANLMPPLGFIGTIIGMVVHFLSSAGTLNNHLAITGIATALYTTFVGLVCYTFLELLLKVFVALGRKRIDEGLAAVADRVSLVPEKKAA